MTTQSFTMEKAKILATMKAKVPTHSWLHTKQSDSSWLCTDLGRSWLCAD